MSDVFSVAKRSEVMSRIRAKGNRSTELRAVTLFRSAALSGWRRSSKLFGKPDFVFPAAKVAVFVDGCFWHGCPKHCRLPKGNAEFWESKINRNRARDRAVSRTLTVKGWKVIRIWEHSLRKPVPANRTVTRIRKAIWNRQVSARL